MNLKTWIQNLRAPKRPDVDIIGIAKEAMVTDFEMEQRELIEGFPVELMTNDERIILTQSLSTFNTEESIKEMPSQYYTGKFRRDMLDKLFQSENAEMLMSTANNTESKYSSIMIPELIGQYSTNEELLNSVIMDSRLQNEHHSIGIVFNKNAPASAMRFAYDYMKENAGNFRRGLDPLENIYLPITSMARNPNTPLDILVDIEDDFGHMDGVHRSAASAARRAIAKRFMPALMSDANARNELASMGYVIDKCDSSFEVHTADLVAYDTSANISLVDGEVVGLDKLPVSTHRAVSSVVFNDFNHELTRRISDIRAAKETVELSFDGIEDGHIL